MRALSSPRHGWTGRVWSHERTIHEDRGGLPARLLGHRQGKVSDSYALARLPRPLLCLHASVYCSQLRPLPPHPHPPAASHSTKTINPAPILSLVACSCFRTLSLLFFLLFSFLFFFVLFLLSFAFVLSSSSLILFLNSPNRAPSPLFKALV